MKKVLWYVSKYASPEKYGFATRHFYLAREFQKNGYDTVIISSNSNHLVTIPRFDKNFTVEIIDGIKTIWCNCLAINKAFSITRIISWIQFEFLFLLLSNSRRLPNPDIIIVSSLSLFTIINGIRLKKKFKCKLVFEVRDIWPLTLISVGGFSRNNLFIRLLSFIEKIGYAKSDLIIGTMPNLKEHVENIIGSTDKCFCIPQGIDIKLFTESEPLNKEYINSYIPRNKFVIGYAGSIGKSNALETLIEVSKKLSYRSDIHFLLVGDGDLKDKFIEETKLQSNITFAPKIKKKQVQTILSYCDIVYDSVKSTELYNYGLSRNKWIDYMFAEKPLLISFNGYYSMLNEANCGFFVSAENVNELMNKVLELNNLTETEITQLGKNGKEWLINNRTFDKLGSEYLKLFNLIDNKGILK